MKITLYLLIIVIVLFPFISNSEESSKKGFPLTKRQIELEEMYKSEGNHLKSEWINPLTFELIYDVTQFYFLTKPEAKELAIKHANAAYVYTLKDVCVKIIVSTKAELAYECVGKNIPSES